MAETKWTPGEWRATDQEWNGDGPADADMQSSIVSEDGWFIAEVWGVGYGDDGPVGIELQKTSQANAHLIASAPGLYAALEQARREWGAFGSLTGETCSQMDAALAKARGWEA